jgi:Cdc6-like AAA superfamily ATPase
MLQSNGGVYIDERTFSRLSKNTQNSIEKLPSLQLKNKRVIQIYSCFSDKILQYEETALQEIVMKDALKSTLLNFLSDMEKIKKPTIVIKKQTLLSFSQASISIEKRRVIEPIKKTNLKYIILEGKLGSGKTSVLKWISKEARNKDLKFVSVQLNVQDSMIEFNTMSKLFEVFSTNIGNSCDYSYRQNHFIKQTLKRVYKENNEKIEKIAYPAMKIALGLFIYYYYY